jgi:hypothetical protein
MPTALWSTTYSCCLVSAPIGGFAVDCLNTDMLITSYGHCMIDLWLARMSRDGVVRLRSSRAASSCT